MAKRTKRKPEPHILTLKRPESPIEAMAAMCVEGVAANAATTVRASGSLLGEIDLTECMVVLSREIAKATESNDARLLEGILIAQSVTLNALFNQLIQKGTNATYFDHADGYMRLAFKAQAQCRATIETFLVSKNPPVFARQANIAQGPQQVNNTVALTRAVIPGDAPNGLLAYDEGLQPVATETTGESQFNNGGRRQGPRDQKRRKVRRDARSST